jgi:acyl carrier protein
MTPKPTTAAADQQAIAEVIRQVVAKMVRTDPATISTETQLFTELGMDSTNALELLMLVEDESGIRIEADNLEHRHLETVGSLAAYFAEQAGG